MKSLPPPSSTFTARKSKILSQLSLPDADYTDLSPKGSVDVGIRDLISEINARDGLVTTSSCAGRVSVYLEGKKSKSSSFSASRPPSQQQQQQSEETNPETGEVGVVVSSSSSTVGGKGGGEWLYVSHDPVPCRENGIYEELFGLKERRRNSGCDDDDDDGKPDEQGKLIHFKFEPMVRKNLFFLFFFLFFFSIQPTFVSLFDPPRDLRKITGILDFACLDCLPRTRTTINPIRHGSRFSGDRSRQPPK